MLSVEIWAKHTSIASGITKVVQMSAGMTVLGTIIATATKPG